MTAMQQVTADLAKTVFRSKMLELRASEDGIVKDISVATLGGVVQPGTVLLTVVPKDEPLVAEVAIENRDIGFVEPASKAYIKLTAFPFQRFGLLNGVVRVIQADSDDQSRQNPARPQSNGQQAPYRIDRVGHPATRGERETFTTASRHARTGRDPTGHTNNLGVLHGYRWCGAIRSGERAMTRPNRPSEKLRGNFINPLLALLMTIQAIVTTSALAESSLGGPTAQWTEEVKTSDGNTVLVERRTTIGASGELVVVRNMGTDELYHRPSGAYWKTDGTHLLVGFGIRDAVVYVTYVVGRLQDCASAGYPKDSLIVFRWSGSTWKRVRDSETPTPPIPFNLGSNVGQGVKDPHPPIGLLTLQQKARTDKGDVEVFLRRVGATCRTYKATSGNSKPALEAAAQPLLEEQDHGTPTGF